MDMPHYVLYRHGDDQMNFILDHYPNERLAKLRVLEHLANWVWNKQDDEEQYLDLAQAIMRQDVGTALDLFHGGLGCKEMDLINWGPVNLRTDEPNKQHIKLEVHQPR